MAKSNLERAILGALIVNLPLGDISNEEAVLVVKKLQEKNGKLSRSITQLLRETKPLNLIVRPENLPFRELAIGGKSVDDLISEFKSAGMEFSSGMTRMLNDKSCVIESVRRKIKLVSARLSEMGFSDLDNNLNDGTSVTKVFSRAADFGFKPCPPEVALYLAIALKNKKLKGDGMWIAHNTIFDTKENIDRMFFIGSGRTEFTPWRANTVYCRSAGLWELDGEIVFMLDK